MKMRLLFLFAMLMAATNVGWGQTNIYVSSSGSDDNEGINADLPLATIAKAIESVEDGGTIHLSTGTYVQSSPLVIAKALKIIGSDSTTCIIEGQIDIQRDVEEDVINIDLKNLQIRKGTTLSQGLINIMSKNVNLNLLATYLHQQTTGTGDGWGKCSIGIANLGKSYDSDGICDNVNIALTNSCIYLAGSYNRGFSSFGDVTKVKNSIVLDNSHILSALFPKSGTYSRGISFSNMDGASLELKNGSSIKGFYYAVNITALNDNLFIKIKDSKIDSWAAINIWSCNNVVNIENSVLESHNYQLKGSNDFATIVLNKDNVTNNTFNISSSEVSAYMHNTACQYPISVRSTGNTFNIGAGSILKVNNDIVGTLVEDELSGSIFNCDETVEFKVADEKSAILVYKKDGSLRNAATNIMMLFKHLSLGDNDKLRFPAGNFELPVAFDLNIPLTIQGAGKDKTFFTTKDDNNALLISATEGTVALKDLCVKGDKEATLNGTRNSAAIAFPNPNNFAGTLSLDNVRVEGYFFGINCGAVTTQANAPKNTMSIKNCEFVDCLHKAIYTENSELVIQNTSFTDCANTTKPTSGWFTAVAVDVNLKYGNYNKVEISGCTFKQNGITAIIPPTSQFPDAIAYSTALGVKARNDGGTYSKNPAKLASVVITGNQFENNSLGIQLGEPQNNAKNELEAVTLADNTFAENHNNIINSSTNVTVPSEVCDEKGLNDAITFAAEGATLKMANNIVLSEVYNKAYGLAANINNMTFNGDGHELSVASPFTGYLITVGNLLTGVKNVKINNLVLDNKKIAKGLNICDATDIELENVTVKNSAGAGIVVNNSTVTATELNTSDNAWGGVNVSKGSPVFTLKSGSLTETSPIYSEILDKEDIVVTPETWERQLIKISEEKSIACWLQRLIIPENEEVSADASYAGRSVYIKKGGTLKASAPLALAQVTMEEGAQLIPSLKVDDKVIATALRFKTSLTNKQWKAFGYPTAFIVQTADGKTTYNSPSPDQKAEAGSWFAGLKSNKSPEFEHKSVFEPAGLLAATEGDYQILSTDIVEFKVNSEPEAPGIGTFVLYANPNTFDMALTKNKWIYILDEANNEFVQWTDAVKTLKPFQSVVLTDEATYSSLRSLRIGSVVTDNESIVPVEGYYVNTEKGAIVIHTASPVQISVIAMSGQILFKGLATDGQRIAVSAGVYAVNGQLYVVK